MGAAMLTQWLSTVPVGRAGRATHGRCVVRTRFVEGLRGDNSGDAAMLARARVPRWSRSATRRTAPQPLSNLALLDAYTGNAQRALQRARRAAQLASGDVSVLSTLGIAYYHAGQMDSARAVFRPHPHRHERDPDRDGLARAACLSDKTKPMSTRVCFNYARTLFELDKAAGLTLLVAYRDIFGQQPWGQEAGRIVFAARNGGSTTLPAGTAAPATPRPATPAPGASSKIGNLGFRSIQLISPDGLKRIGTGMRPREARAAVPGVAEAAGSGAGTEGRVLQSDEAGVGLLVQPDPAGGERVVGIVSSGGWSLAGITPGQPVSALSRLGRPVDRDENTYVYVVTGHLVRVVTDGTVIRSIVVRTDQ